MKKSRELKAGLFNLLVVIAVLTGIGLLLYPTVSNWLTVFPLKADELPAASGTEEEGVTYI